MVTGGGCGALEAKLTLLGRSQMASNLHHVEGGSQLATFLKSSQQGPLILRSSRKRSNED